MKRILSIVIMLSAIVLRAYGQSYVDSGIQHYNREEYAEALNDFESALGLKQLLTESANGKLHFYYGMTWLQVAEKGKPKITKKDVVMESYSNLKLVSNYSDQWDDQVAQAYARVSSLLEERVDDLDKQVRKADGIEGKLSVIDQKISVLKLVHEMGVAFENTLNLARAYKEGGDLIFENTKEMKWIMRAKFYYETSVPLYEEARYDDPFSKEIIKDLLLLSQRLADQERIKEYEKLLELAGG